MAGDRAPDAPMRGAGGLPVRLFGLFKGPHWTLLGYEVDRKQAPPPRPGLHIHNVGPGGALVDDAPMLRPGYGVEPETWILVRPDGYVGAVVPNDEVERLGDYMTGVGLPVRQTY